MDSDAILDAVHELKGLYVILSSMSFDAKKRCTLRAHG